MDHVLPTLQIHYFFTISSIGPCTKYEDIFFMVTLRCSCPTTHQTRQWLQSKIGVRKPCNTEPYAQTYITGIIFSNIL